MQWPDKAVRLWDGLVFRRPVEQRPRAQSRGTVTQIKQGHGLIFTTRDRPVASARGWSAAPVRHGVSAIRSGSRHALGLVFHDAA